MISTNTIFLKKLKLTACNEKGKPLTKLKPFELMLNPENYTVQSNVHYTDDAADGNTSGAGSKFKYVAAKEITLGTFILDVTGAVPFTLSALYGSMKEVIDHLENVVYNFDGEIHRTPIVLVEWGILSYKAELKSMSVKYTLFAENGDPLRAEVTLSMQEYLTEEEKAAREKKSSPDLTHFVEVKVGDTLPLMCNRIYKDCSYYREVAEINGLHDFCHLTPGTFLYFPPLVD